MYNLAWNYNATGGLEGRRSVGGRVLRTRGRGSSLTTSPPTTWKNGEMQTDEESISTNSGEDRCGPMNRMGFMCLLLDVLYLGKSKQLAYSGRGEEGALEG